MPEETCLVCCHRGLDPHWEVLLRCPACGFVTARRDAPLDARQLYGGDYFTGGEYLDYRADEALFRKTFRRRLDHILRRRSGGRLLEIGAAYGYFLDLAQRHFQVVGFEVNAAAARYGRETFGVDIRTDDFLDAGATAIGGAVDVIVMWDVIEHLDRPDRYLARIAELSAPGALLYITTGDIGSALARWRGPKWRMIHPPTHLHYFDRRTLPRLLADHGFRVIEMRSIGVARSIRQVLYSLLVLRFGMERAYQSARRLLPATWGFTLNTFDIMLVVSQKS